MMYLPNSKGKKKLPYAILFLFCFQIDILNEPRPGKKLLVLDIDYTLFDHRSAAEQGYELMRPYLHEFLTSAYKVRFY
jgi:NLI interacting factor-like phosphatase.